MAMIAVCVSVAGALQPQLSQAQDLLPRDSSLPEISGYHPAPRYRESESHPLRIVAYVLHPIGWAARELLFRPLSYFASSTPETRSIMGYREPFDYRQPSCFSASEAVPDCRNIIPFNYSRQQPQGAADGVASLAPEQKAVYFPDVNFDFNQRVLNQSGKGKVAEVAKLLSQESGVKVVLQGHTDLVGGESYNMKLGMDRAEAVRQELVALGTPADRLSTISFGESQPLFTEDTPEAQAANRRVEVRLDEGAGAEKIPAGAPQPNL
jgi:outer membrane protein OmpA-like peptidoglycan-associated protein